MTDDEVNEILAGLNLTRPRPRTRPVRYLDGMIELAGSSTFRRVTAVQIVFILMFRGTSGLQRATTVVLLIAYVVAEIAVKEYRETRPGQPDS